MQAHSVLLQPANMLRDEVFGQRIATLFEKPEDGEDGRLVSERIRLTRVRIQASFILKGEEIKPVAANF